MKIAILWLLLVGLTLLTWWAGQVGYSGQWLVVALLISVFTKGHFIIADFMALREVSPLWRILVHGWLVLVLCLIYLAYWVGM
ncbi:MAG: cytochrome C oxidase subunit IV family protein [Thiothrix sp.]|uniref:cytochrome C oxidase subunit IV family protein n=1 Tax=Thiothrix sp. TaxID=1032 RepID=UPI0026129DA8|nr:cytochrome C oxidase subunit IV family protein [Thiothrix sp.]MDD5395048.1 cytochrome C oxidase subunit IV family protein [Thiothrix sp.]